MHWENAGCAFVLSNIEGKEMEQFLKDQALKGRENEQPSNQNQF